MRRYTLTKYEEFTSGSDSEPATTTEPTAMASSHAEDAGSKQIPA